METPLKQRLIGAVVLAALALIFVPMLLRSPDVRDPDSADVSLKIPDEPDVNGIKTIEIPLDQPAAAVPAEQPELPDIEPIPVVDDAVVAAGQYAVVITASDEIQAKAIAEGLKAQRLAPIIQSNGQRFRIRIGPYVSRDLAEAARLRSTAVVSGGKVVAMDAVAVGQTGSASGPIQSSAPAKANDSLVASAPVVAAATKPASAPAPLKTAVKPEPAIDAKGFAVQIGAPANEQAAQALRDKARAAGFSSYIQPVDTESGRRYRVRIGPEHSREAATTLLASVKQKTGIDGIVVKHP
ncbi:MAG: SPOR domain-containing protein [Arenimonas sp.]|jgi:cell division septation protein DedD|nr:SPOR domain-containing protein [Arenimonas sp.]